MASHRKPAQAGRFYPADPKELSQEVKNHIDKNAVKEIALGIVAPHAGYIYSGKAAGALYSRIKFPDTIIILGPNHTGLGADTAIITEGEWIMPGGNVFINKELAESILENSKSIIKKDNFSHSKEHSLEVQLPFIQHFTRDFSIVPICMKDYRVDTCRKIGEAIAKSLKHAAKALIVASSDMSHYVSATIAEQKDRLAIDKILALDPEGLLQVVAENHISMCGSGPVAAMLFAVKELGAKKAELVLYNTSGDASGDYSEVVGYASIIVK